MRSGYAQEECAFVRRVGVAAVHDGYADEEVLEQKPDRDAIEKWASDVLVKLGEIHEDVRELQRDLA